ncbi:MAG: LysR family transcriptional regulator substrate-binding protein, partial [bacterium]|nr:LysR family transcriptional regulator substrate-binding protein [bacterium]
NYFSALEAFVAMCRNQPGKLVIGTGESLIHWLMLPTILPKLKKHMGQTSFIFKNRRSKTIIDDLITGKIDIGLVRTSALNKLGTGAGKLKKVPLNAHFKHLLFVPADLAQGLRNPLSFEEMANLPLTILEGKGELRLILEEQVKKKKLELNINIECSSSTQVSTLIKQ